MFPVLDILMVLYQYIYILMFLNLGLSEFYLMTSVVWFFGGKNTKAKCHSHHVICVLSISLSYHFDVALDPLVDVVSVSFLHC